MVFDVQHIGPHSDVTVGFIMVLSRVVRRCNCFPQWFFELQKAGYSQGLSTVGAGSHSGRRCGFSQVSRDSL